MSVKFDSPRELAPLSWLIFFRLRDGFLVARILGLTLRLRLWVDHAALEEQLAGEIGPAIDAALAAKDPRKAAYWAEREAKRGKSRFSLRARVVSIVACRVCGRTRGTVEGGRFRCAYGCRVPVEDPRG